MIIFDNIIYSLQRFGGISMMWHNLSQGLIERGCDVYFLEYDNADESTVRGDVYPPDRVIRVPAGMLQFKRYLPVILPGVIKRNITKPFVFHSSYYRYCTHPLACNVTTVHDYIYERYYSGLKRSVHHMQKTQAIMHSRANVCVSRNTAKDLIIHTPGVNPNTVHTIYNGMSMNHLNDTDKVDGIADSIVYVGNREVYKNFDFVVQAIKATGLNLIVTGRPLSKKETRMLDSILGPNRWRYFRADEQKLVYGLYRGAFALMYPSSYEGFGYPIIEAQMCRCPVIALRGSAINEVAGSGTTTQLSSLSIDEFKGMLQHIRDNREQIVEAGVQNASRFTADAMCEQYINLYHSLLNDFN